LPENVKGLILFVANIQVMYDPVKTGFLYWITQNETP
jgi:hypothetical protein